MKHCYYCGIPFPDGHILQPWEHLRGCPKYKPKPEEPNVITSADRHSPPKDWEY
jgi:hypothetical protein